jgi:hypothetical protein
LSQKTISGDFLGGHSERQKTTSIKKRGSEKRHLATLAHSLLLWSDHNKPIPSLCKIDIHPFSSNLPLFFLLSKKRS